MKVITEKSAYALETNKVDNTRQGVISGKVKLSGCGAESYLTVGGHSVSEFLENFWNKKVWCIWATADHFITPEYMIKTGWERVNGIVTTQRGAVYSEPTGYLWTDDEGNIGGYDLVRNLQIYADKYAFICVRQAQIDLNKIEFIDEI